MPLPRVQGKSAQEQVRDFTGIKKSDFSKNVMANAKEDSKKTSAKQIANIPVKPETYGGGYSSRPACLNADPKFVTNQKKSLLFSVFTLGAYAGPEILVGSMSAAARCGKLDR